MGKLCALRNNEKGTTVSSSIANSALAKDLRKVIGRNSSNGSNTKTQPKKLQSAHAIRQNARLAALSEAAQRLTPMIDSEDSSSIYKCPICNIGYSILIIKCGSHCNYWILNLGLRLRALEISTLVEHTTVQKNPIALRQLFNVS